jgi:hypothetical protein
MAPFRRPVERQEDHRKFDLVPLTLKKCSFNLSMSPINAEESTLLNQNGPVVHEKPSARLARKILSLIQKYSQNVVTRDDTWLSKAKFASIVESQIESREAVRLILPAFPSKSPNKLDKVLGPLPDMGEELALAHLNGLCHNIADIYEPGATVTILSDGLVYNG